MVAPVRISRRLRSQEVADGIEIIQSDPFDESSELARIMITRDAAERLLPILKKLASGKRSRRRTTGASNAKGPPGQD